MEWRAPNSDQLHHSHSRVDQSSRRCLRHGELGAEDAVSRGDDDDRVSGEGKAAVDVRNGDGFDGDVERVEDVRFGGGGEGLEGILRVVEGLGVC